MWNNFHFAEMHRQMQEAFRMAVENDGLAVTENGPLFTESQLLAASSESQLLAAASESQLLVANVGEAFRERSFADEL